MVALLGPADLGRIRTLAGGAGGQAQDHQQTNEVFHGGRRGRIWPNTSSQFKNPAPVTNSCQIVDVAASAANSNSTRRLASEMSCGVPNVVNMEKKESAPSGVSNFVVSSGARGKDSASFTGAGPRWAFTMSSINSVRCASPGMARASRRSRATSAGPTSIRLVMRRESLREPPVHRAY
jgi:hypothetical protein